MEYQVADPELFQQLVNKVADLRSNPEPWMEHGACRDHPAVEGESLWFPSVTVVEPAVSICDTCPVQTDCDEYADVHKQKFGVWGGKSRRARVRSIKEREAAEANGTL